MPVAVANALPRLKDAAALVAQGKRGEGMAKLVDRWLATTSPMWTRQIHGSRWDWEGSAGGAGLT